MLISEDRFQTLSDQCKGYCLKCKKVTRGQCEPDARNYPCPKCKENKVMGIEEALMMGHIDIK